MSSQLTIRPSTKKDVPLILQLIHDLAVYEREPDAVKASEADLLRDGFGENPTFQCLMGDIDGHVQGFALYFFTWSTWEGRPTLYLEDLFVRPEARGAGLGFQLFQSLATIAVEKNCARFEWAVLDWNQLARDFYHRLGAQHKQGWLPYRIEGAALTALASANPLNSNRHPS